MESNRRRAVYWGIGLILGALLLAVLAGLAWSSSPTTTSLSPWGWHGWMMGGYPSGGWGIMMILGMLSMALFWIGIILLAIWAIRAIASPGATQPSLPTPLEIAKARYARGEINKEEYERLRKDLA